MKIHKPKLPKEIQIKGSKSETNRLLILQKVLGAIEILNPSSSQDTELLKSALASQNKIIDVHNAGTAMRFLTSFFATQEGRETLLTGSERMKQRPISPLVEALQELGADIQYRESRLPSTQNKGQEDREIFGENTGRYLLTIHHLSHPYRREFSFWAYDRISRRNHFQTLLRNDIKDTQNALS